MKLTRPLIAAVALSVALVGAALAGVVAHATASAKTTSVTEKDYRLILSSKKVPAGPVKFVIRNASRTAHAFAVAGPGLRTKRTKTIEPGKSATLLVTLRAGKVSVWCPMPGHAALGMKATITVPGAAPVAGGGGATTSTPAPTTTDGGEAWG